MTLRVLPVKISRHLLLKSADEDTLIKLRMPYEGRRKFNGVISGIEGHDVVIQVDQEEFLFPIEAIEKANIIPQFD